MAKPKTYKTLAGVLRSFEDQIYNRQSRAEMDGKVFDRNGAIRQAVEHVMPQIGITAPIGADEPIGDALRRIRTMPDYQAKAKDVDKLIKFVRGPWIASFKPLGSTPIDGGSIKSSV